MKRGRKTDIEKGAHVEELTRAQKREIIRNAFLQAVQFREYQDLDEWADEHIFLPQETSSEFGRWNTQRFPFLRRPMKLLSPSYFCRSISFVKGAQLGLTTIGLVWLLYISKHVPAPSLYVQKTDDAAKDYSTQKLKPMIDACPAVYDTLGRGKSPGYANTVFNKGFPGGFIALGGVTSDVLIRSKSIKYSHIDEESSFEFSAGKSGSPLLNIFKRQVTFSDRKALRTSTPGFSETCTITQAYEAGSKERYYLPCPHCNPEADPAGFMFWIKWEMIKWSEEKNAEGIPERVWLECPNCAGEIQETSKTWMLDRGDWYALDDEGNRYQPGDVEFASFHISSLYSPDGFFSWRDAVIEWFNYRRSRDPNLLQVFVNQTLGEAFTLEGTDISYNWLMSRREVYPAEVPKGGLVLTCGVDVQKDRLELEVVAWGLYEESWSVDYVVLMGDTANFGDQNMRLSDGQPSVWLLLDQYLQKQFQHQSGCLMPIECTMIDAHYNSDQVQLFCRVNEYRRIFPINGVAGWGKGFYSRSKKRHDKFKTWTFTSYPDEVKTRLYSQFQITEPGPGFCHWPQREVYGDHYFKGLVCERRETKLVNGRNKLVWIAPPGARNEPIDVRNYAYVAFLAYPVNLEQRAEAPTPLNVVKPKMRTKRRGSKGL